MKKKIIALCLVAALAVSMCFMFAACGDDKKSATDAEYVQEKGKLVIGYTLFAPMNFEDDNQQLTGFETEFAKAVCAKLGLEAEFRLIEWSAKETELASKSIDCIWNGMTITPERAENMSISTPYMANKQVLVVKAENAAKYTTADSLEGVRIVAEQESAGEEVAKTDAFFAKANYKEVATQADALAQVKAGYAEGCVVDYVCSIGMIGEGTDYADLVVVDELAFADEQYGIAFRQGSDLTAKVNAAITELVNDGTLMTIAEKYKLQDQIIAK